ncbi:MAG: carboxypeptidase regulatory-like domain-containing protein, partial [Acidobacteria bacterium]|nr:carboxypeptidase regulatory-like domain-containing protein [Acidobacteriota bacterium]
MLLLSAAELAFGQASSINGQILGTVTDATGAAIAGTKVTATNINTGLQQTAETESSGLYRFNLLPLGQYELTFEKAGFARLKQTGIEVNAGATVTRDVALPLPTVSTEVVVNASAGAIDPSRTDT